MEIKTIRWLILAGLILAGAVPFLVPAHGAEGYRDPNLPVDERVRDLLGRMTLEEKIAQLSQKGAEAIAMTDAGADAASLRELFGERSVGVLCARFGDDLFESARRLAAGQRYLRE
ncbi:MAG: hypothetical protein JXP34_04180, partial [Planctomycetes bacterium]|nr:hypothetical protein [Planctomycetota bacterium]